MSNRVSKRTRDHKSQRVIQYTNPSQVTSYAFHSLFPRPGRPLPCIDRKGGSRLCSVARDKDQTLSSVLGTHLREKSYVQYPVRVTL